MSALGHKHGGLSYAAIRWRCASRYGHGSVRWGLTNWSDVPNSRTADHALWNRDGVCESLSALVRLIVLGLAPVMIGAVLIGLA
jgi:hypothetical protein